MKANRIKDVLLSETAIYIAVVLASSIGAWFIPGKYHFQFVFGILILGIIFDLLSLFFHSITLITRKFMSGFPYVGLFFYAWFLFASNFSLVAQQETSILRILMFKLVDATLLVAIHGLCQLPMFFKGPRESTSEAN